MTFLMIFKQFSIGVKLSKYIRSINCSQTQQMSTSLFRSTNKNDLGPIAYFLLIIPAGTFCLGTWQIKRREWKLGLIEEMRSKTTANPIPLPDNLEELSTMEYSRVKVQGVFVHDREMYIRPRSLVPQAGTEDSGKGLISVGQMGTGAFIVTPFKLSNGDKTVLVNRGWVPRNKMAPNTRLEGQIEGQVELIGILRLSEKRVPLGPKPTPEDHPFWGFRDVENMAQLSGSSPVFLDACITKLAHPNAPIAGQTRVTLRNEHLSYIMTWYSLSAITSYMWFRRFIRR